MKKERKKERTERRPHAHTYDYIYDFIIYKCEKNFVDVYTIVFVYIYHDCYIIIRKRRENVARGRTKKIGATTVAQRFSRTLLIFFSPGLYTIIYEYTLDIFVYIFIYAYFIQRPSLLPQIC